MAAVRPLTVDTYMEEKLPLVGLYPCLTWQLNVTLHQSQGTAKFVSVIREPSDHIELRRDHCELNDHQLVLPRLVELNAELPREMRRLMGWDSPR